MVGSKPRNMIMRPSKKNQQLALVSSTRVKKTFTNKSFSNTSVTDVASMSQQDSSLQLPPNEKYNSKGPIIKGVAQLHRALTYKSGSGKKSVGGVSSHSSIKNGYQKNSNFSSTTRYLNKPASPINKSQQRPAGSIFPKKVSLDLLGSSSIAPLATPT